MIGLLLLLATTATGLPEQEATPSLYHGTIMVVGNAPHPELILVTEEATYELVGGLSEILYRRYQQQVVTLRARPMKRRLMFPVLEPLEIVIEVDDTSAD